MIANWDAAGASRVKNFDKIVVHMMQSSGDDLAEVFKLVVPGLLKYAMEAAERDLESGVKKNKKMGATLSGAPATPSVPGAASSSKEPGDSKQSKHEKDPKKQKKKEKENADKSSAKAAKEKDGKDKERKKKKRCKSSESD